MDTDESADSLLGTLRSELDEDEDGGLHPSFEVLAGLVVTVRTAYTSFRLSPEQAAMICADLRILGRDGYEWTVGATTGSWYKRRTGETVWQKSPLPINVLPADGATPSWLTEGIAGRILAAEQATKERAEDERQEEKEPVDDPFGRGVINPFQRKHVDESALPVVSVSAPTGIPTASTMDVDWLLEEWEDFERENAGAARETQRPTGGLPAKLPKDIDPAEAESRYLDEALAPVERAGSDQSADAPVERDGPITPDDYFLRPED